MRKSVGYIKRASSNKSWCISKHKIDRFRLEIESYILRRGYMVDDMIAITRGPRV
ncbi:hypothetical protein KS4_23140 [Poriferisphaera corsica]|uniref:Uncharacterized protein n=1 Tax=Poriferisphaera corsica TaxID=2528020 RepID=A0A517YVI8_9BACT|nr:hypothetical protein KS4_23140 [Poriferisphaera corsica]